MQTGGEVEPGQAGPTCFPGLTVVSPGTGMPGLLCPCHPLQLWEWRPLQ